MIFLIDFVFNPLCFKRENRCGCRDTFVIKLHIFDEIVAVNGITETEFVRINHSIFDANFGVKKMTFVSKRIRIIVICS